MEAIEATSSTPLHLLNVTLGSHRRHRTLRSVPCSPPEPELPYVLISDGQARRRAAEPHHESLPPPPRQSRQTPLSQA
jgi:hypothetical protein